MSPADGKRRTSLTLTEVVRQLPPREPDPHSLSIGQVRLDIARQTQSPQAHPVPVLAAA